MTQWLMAREAVGLQNEGRFDKPFIPRFDIGGHPLQQEVTASEIGSFLRMALNIPNKHHNEIRGHSLKVTCLSWSGKFGVSLESRRLLGHHLTPDAVSAETYSRDSMGPAVRDLLNVLRMIKHAGATVYRHVISGIQHLATQASSNENKLVCGRRLNDGSVVADAPLCETCSHRDP